MTTASDLVAAEKRLKEMDDLFATLANPRLEKCTFEVLIGGYSFRLNENAAPEMVRMIRANLEREELNLRALLRKHGLFDRPLNLNELRARLAQP